MKCLDTFCHRDFPCNAHKNEIEGWIFGPSIYKKKDTVILLTKRATDLTYDWVIKCAKVSSHNEILYISTLLEKRVKHCVEFPDKYAYYGSILHVSWYVMKHYPRICTPVKDYVDFQLIMRTCLEFIKDIHIKTKYVYLDWRLDNILKKQDNKYVISDYEFLETPLTTSASFVSEYIENKDYLYYFLQHGANLDESLLRYRTDLESIGFLAIKFLELNEPDWSVQCTKSRTNQNTIYTPPQKISDDRDIYKTKFIQSHSYLTLYFQKIKECSWATTEHMPSEWYDSLISIFNNSNPLRLQNYESKIIDI